MIGKSAGHGGSDENFSPAILGTGRSPAQLVMIVVGEEVAFSATTPEPYLIVSHHTALQCMVMCD
jgi:hypothetical protein